MMDGRTAIAAQNNALLCAAVLRAQGQESEIADGFWRCLGPGLTFYPTIVTLSSAPSPLLTSALAALPTGASVKDSYVALNLSGQGFRKIFDACWLWRPATIAGNSDIGEVVRSPTGFASWCRAWGDQAPELFSADLLRDPDITFFAVPNGMAIMGGAIINRGPGEAAGISNLFDLDGGGGVLKAVVSRYGDLDLVGYESDAEQIETYITAGFENLGPLAIYLKE